MNTCDTLQHYRNEATLQPLFSSLDDLSKRVKDAEQRTTKTRKPHAESGGASPEDSGQFGGAHAPQMEQQDLPAGSTTFPCFEGVHDWEALQAEVNLASRHFSLPAAKVAWKKWALGASNAQVVVAVAWWVVAHIYQSSNPLSPRLQADVLQAFSQAYAKMVLTCRKDLYIRLWLEVVAAAAVRLLREAFPNQYKKLEADMGTFVTSQLLRWSSGLLPSDMAPSPEALRPTPSSTPNKPPTPQSKPFTPPLLITTGSVHGASVRGATPPLAMQQPTTPSSIQPAAVTMCQKHFEHQRDQQQEFEFVQARMQRTIDDSQPEPSQDASQQNITSPATQQAQDDVQQQQGLIAGIASGAFNSPSLQWLSVQPSPNSPHPNSAQAQARTSPSQGIASTELNQADGEALPSIQPTKRSSSQGVALSSSSGVSPGVEAHTGSEGVQQGSKTFGELKINTGATGTYRTGPTTTQRRRSSRPKPAPGQYHSGYQQARRHQHFDVDQGGDQGMLAVGGIPGGRGYEGQGLWQQSQQQQVQQIQQQQQQALDPLNGGGSQARMQQQQQGGSTHNTITLHTKLFDNIQNFLEPPPPPALTQTKGFMTKQISPAVSLLLQRTSGSNEDCRPPSPPIFPGDRHDTVGSGQPAMRQPLRGGAALRPTLLGEVDIEDADPYQSQQQHGRLRPHQARNASNARKQEAMRAWAGLTDDEADLQDAMSYAKTAAAESTQRAADAVARYEAIKKSTRREVAVIHRGTRAMREGLNNLQRDLSSNQGLADQLSGWVESWGDAGRTLKGKPTATTAIRKPDHSSSPAGKAKTKGHGGSSSSLTNSYGSKASPLPQNSTDAVLGAKGGASVGAASGVRSKGVPCVSASAADPTGYSQMTEAAVAGIRQAGASILAACAATARSAPPSTTRIMQPWSRMRAVQARAQRALSPSRHSAADVASHIHDKELTQAYATAKAASGVWRPTEGEHKRGTLSTKVHQRAQKAMHGIDFDLYKN